MPSLRTANSRTFRDVSGYRSDIYPGPVNYQDADGTWQPIDDTIVPSPEQGGGWVNRANSVAMSFPADLSQPVTMKVRGASLSMTLEGATVAGHVDGNSVSYPSALPGTTFTYTAGNDRIKEDISLSGPTSTNSFRFAVSTKGQLTPSTAADGGIDWATPSGTVAFHSLPASMQDAAGATSTSVKMTFAPASGGGYEVSVVADPTWLAAPGRAWPVVIDPSNSTMLGYYQTNGAPYSNSDCYISSAAPTTNYCGSTTMSVGYDGTNKYRGLIKFPVLTPNDGLLADDVVTSAYLQVYIASQSGSGPTLAPAVTSKTWTTGATWNTYDGTNAWTSPGGDSNPLVSSMTCGSASCGGYFDATAVQGWVAGSTPNGGLLLKTNETTNDVIQFATWENTNTSEWPVLTIRYAPHLGEAGYYRMLKTGLTDRSSAQVNVANGNLVLDSTDLNVAGTGLPLTVRRLFNLQDTFTIAPMSPHWSLSVGPSVYLDTNAGLGIELIGHTGESVYFEPNGSGGYIAPPGVNATLTTSGGYKLTFNQTQEVYTFVNDPANANWNLLSTDTDRNGNRISYTYDSNGYLTTITDTQGRSVSVALDSNHRLHTLTMTTSAGTRTYTYNWNGAGLLASYVDPANGQTTYTYDAGNNYVTEIQDARGNITTFGYTWTQATVNPLVTSMTQVTNPNNLTGPTTTYAYDQTLPSVCSSPSGLHATTVTDPNGHTTTYCSNNSDEVVYVVDARGNVETAGYDGHGDVTSTQDAATTNNPASYAYDSNFDLQTATAPFQFSGDNRAAQHYLYDLTSGSGVTGYQYLPSSSVAPSSNTNANDAGGNCTSYTYDPAGNVVKVSPGQPLASGVTNCDNTLGSTVYEYGRQGDTLDGSSVSCTGAKPGEICFTKDANGNKTNYTYDTNGNLISATPPSPQGATTYTVDGLSRVSSVADGIANSGGPGTIASVQTGNTDWSVGNVGSVSVSLPVSVTSGDAIILMVATRAQNTTVSSVSGGGVTWTKGPTKSDGAVGDLEVWYGTGSSGGSASITATLSNSTTQAAAFAQEFTGVATASALDTSGNHNGNTTTETSPNLNTHQGGDVVWMATNSVSNVTGWPTSAWNSLNGPKYTNGNYYNSIAWQIGPTAAQYTASWALAAANSWDTVGVALKPGSRLTSYTYDSFDRVTQVVYGTGKVCVPSGGQCIIYSYDADGNLTSQVDQTGTTTFIYDSLNRVVEKDVASNPTNACSGFAGMRYAYDGAGNLTSYCDSGGTVMYSYDAANNLVGLAEPGGNCTPGQVVQPCTTFNYDADERLATTGTAPNQTPAETLPSGTGTVVNIGYDGAGNTDVISYEKGLSGCATQNSSTCFVNNGYFFYLTVGSTQVDTGLVQAVSDNNATATIFRNYYDPRDQLTQSQETQGGSANYLYAYDNNGNRCNLAATCSGATYTYNADNELTKGPAGNYTYDADGNQITSPALTNLTYNAKVQTTSITPSGQSAEAIGYAGAGQADRISLGTTTFANGLGGQVMEQVSGSNTIYFTRLPNGQLLSMRTGGYSYYYLRDHLGSVLGLVDSTGSRTNGATYSYDPYGQQLSSSGPEASVNPYGFAGGYFDSNAKLLQFGQRYYDPATGRWTQPDPLAGGYIYANNAPTSSSDPTGLFNCSGFFGYLSCLSPSDRAGVEAYLTVRANGFSPVIASEVGATIKELVKAAALGGAVIIDLYSLTLATYYEDVHKMAEMYEMAAEVAENNPWVRAEQNFFWYTSLSGGPYMGGG